MASYLLGGGAVGGADFVGKTVFGCIENKLPQLVRFCISILVASGTGA
jgi:hypothetical protein